MTIRLITGIPGSGKTLYAVSELKKELEKNLTADEPRKIYCDITGLKVDSVEIPPIDWRQTPPRSLLIYDEAQLRNEFKASRGNSPYEFIAELTIHRKTGHEIWFITQAPKRLHNDILDMVEIHHHLERPYGAKLASIYEYRGHEKNPSSISAKDRAQNKTLFNYDKSLYELYESSQVKDGIKFRLPRELTVWIILAILVGIFFYFQVTSKGTQKYVNNALGKDTPAEENQSTTDKVKQQVIQDAPNPTDSEQTAGQGIAPQMTKEQLEKQLKLQEQQFNLLLEQQRLQFIMQYEQLQKQLVEHDEQMKEFYRTLELYKTMLPKDHKILKANPDLQVRAVVKMGNKCKAYNHEGVLMTLNADQCSYYTEATGRVWKNGQTSDNSPKEPRYPPTLTDNSTTTVVPNQTAPAQQTAMNNQETVSNDQ